MITIPSVLTYNDIILFPDDVDCNKYYYLRSTPRLRQVNGEPVFRATFWTDKADGTMKSTAGIAGGEVKMDINLAVTDKEKEEIEKKIKQLGIQKRRFDVLAERQMEKQELRNRALPESMKKTVNASGVIPVGEVVLDSILFKSGTVDVLEEEGGALVTSTSSGGSCSNFSDNNAAARISLSPDGGAVWYKALNGENLAIGVRYNLKTQIRVPSLEIRAYASSYVNQNVEKKITIETKDKERVFLWFYKKTKATKIDLTKSLVESGAIEIEIKKGSTELTTEYVEKLQESIINIIANKLEAIINSKVQAISQDKLEDTRLELDIEDTLSEFTEIRFTQEDVMEWSFAPQATITELFAGVGQDKRKKLVALYDLSKNEVSTSVIDVSVTAPWDQAPNVVGVQVDLVCPTANDGKGKRESFLFKKDTPMQQWMFRSPKDGNEPIKYTATAMFLGRKGTYTMSGTSQGVVLINIPMVGIIDLTFKPHPQVANLLGKKEVTSIEVEISYDDEKKKKLFNDKFVLYPKKEEGYNFKRDLGIELTQPVKYKETYLFSDGSRKEMPVKSYPLTDDGVSTIYTEYPFKDSLDINVNLPFEPGPGMKKIRVEFNYVDKANDFDYSDAYTVSEEDDWELPTIHIPMINKNQDKYKYRYLLYTGSSIVTSEWEERQGEAESIVLPIRQNRLLTTLLGIGNTFTQGILKITSSDNSYNNEIILDPNNVAQPIEWYNVEKGQVVTYTYHLTLFSVEGDVIEQSGTWTDNTFYIPKPNVPTVEVPTEKQYSIMANLLGIGTDFMQGILMIKLDDGTEIEPIILDEANSNSKIYWSAPNGAAVKKFTYTLSLYDMEGNAIEIEGTCDKPLLVLAKPKVEKAEPEEPSPAVEETPAKKEDTIMANLLGIGKDYIQGILMITLDDGTEIEPIILDEFNSMGKLYWSAPDGAAVKKYKYNLTLYDQDGNAIEIKSTCNKPLLVLAKPKVEKAEPEEPKKSTAPIPETPADQTEADEANPES